MARSASASGRESRTLLVANAMQSAQAPGRFVAQQSRNAPKIIVDYARSSLSFGMFTGAVAVQQFRMRGAGSAELGYPLRRPQPRVLIQRAL